VILSWTAGVDANSHDVYFSTSFAEVNDANSSWPVAGGPNDPNVYKGRQDFNSYDPCGLELGITYYWRVDEVNESYGNSPWKGDVWSFTINDGTAWSPSPEDGAEDEATDVVLSWVPGIYAAYHDVYLGTDPCGVRDATTSSPEWKPPRLAVGANSYDPGGLELGEEIYYYWRIDEVNASFEPYLWKGDVWSFTTGHIVVDDFELYVADPALWTVWHDWFYNDTGAEVFLETDANFTRDGNSMRYVYNSAYLSKGTCYGSVADTNTTRLGIGSDWTVSGVEALVLYFYGDPCNSATADDQLWLQLEDTSSNSGLVLYDDMNDVKEPNWHEWNIILQDFNDINNVVLTDVSKLYIGFGGSTIGGNCKADGSGTVWFDDIRLYPPRCVPEYGPAGDISGDCVVDYNDIGVMGGDWLLFDYNIPVEEPCDANLLVEYLFDNNDLEDTSGNNYDGVEVNSPVISGGVLTLDGNEFVEIGSDFNQVNPFDGSCDFSIVIEFQTSEPGILISSARDNNSLNHSMSVYIPECDQDVFYGNFRVGAAGVADNPLDGEWHTMVTTYDAETEVHITYLDYQQGEEIKFDPDIPNIEEDMVRIGASLNTEYPYKIYGNFVGDIDNIRIYDYTLTYNEVLWILGERNEYNVAFDSPAELYSQEPVGEKLINFRDYDILAQHWLEGPILWP
jgi:hypothetical protein